MRRKKTISLFFVLILTLTFSLIFRSLQADEPEGGIIPELKLFSKAVSVIMEGYVKDMVPRQLLYSAVKGMMTGLDPYSEFIDEEKYGLLKIDMSGEYSGLGAVLEMVGEQIAIKGIQPESAADIAGLKIHDQIVKVDETFTKGKAIAEIAGLLRGDENTKVILSILRPPATKPFDVTVIRKKIEIPAVKDVRMIGKSLGYLRIDNWQDHTPEQTTKAVEGLLASGMKALIIDLRDNGGGLMSSAIDLANSFLPKDTRLISVDSKIDVQKKQFTSPGDKTLPDFKMIVMVNERSASASEIFSASMQDNGRATILGVKTFGKASVQSVVPLDEKTAMKLTTARYLSPKGTVIDGVGIEPDVVIEYGKPGEDLQIRKALDLFKEYM